MKKFLVGGGIVLIVGIMFMLNLSKSSTSGREVKGRVITTGSLSSKISCSGDVEAIEQVEIVFDTNVKIEEILVEENQFVSEGTPLFRVSTSELEDELNLLQSKLITVELQLKSMEIDSNLTDTKNLEIQIDKEKKNIKYLEQQVTYQQSIYDNNQSLFNEGVISKRDLELVASELDQAILTLEKAKLSYDGYIAQLKEANENNNRAEISNDINKQVQKQQIKDYKMQVEQLERKINSIEEQVKSPISGVVTSLNIIEGAYSGTSSLATIVNLDKLQVKAYVGEYNISTVAVGQHVELTGEAFPMERIVSGKIKAINPVAKKLNIGTVEETVIEVIISIDKEELEAFFRPGITTNCDIFTSEKEDVVIVKMDCITEDKYGNKIVYIVDEALGIVQETKVRVGIISTMEAEIAEGLKAGDVVVIDPKLSLKDGDKVQVNMQSDESDA